MKKKKRPSLVQMMGIRQASPRTKAGAKWLSKIKKGRKCMCRCKFSLLHTNSKQSFFSLKGKKANFENSKSFAATTSQVTLNDYNHMFNKKIGL